jgi:GNAT superfamily N-acetyltransferase
MVFWDAYPITQLFSATSRFTPHPINKKRIPSPTGHSSQMVMHGDQLQEVRRYLRTHFRNSPQMSHFDIPESHLLGPHDHLMIVRDDHQIVGSIRYHYLGQLLSSQEEPIYEVNCFCIHPQWRKKGIGDYLLTQLHWYVNENNIPYSMFVKDGLSLSILLSPIYTGSYAYRALTVKSYSLLIQDLTIHQAHRFLQIHHELTPDRFIVHCPNGSNQYWKWYKKGLHSILACVQDSFQRFGEKSIGSITAWMESSMITDEIRQEAAELLSDACYPEFDYICMNQTWTGGSSLWTYDGLFHWYTYQWSTTIRLGQSYCLLM